MKKPAVPETPEAYIAALEEPRRTEVAKLHALITKAVPKLTPHMVAGMIGYGNYHYKYASGREGDWPPIALSSRKQYISVYVCGTEDGEYVAEKHKDELPGANIGKSCIRFRKTADIDLKVLEKLIKLGARALAKSTTA